LKGEAVEAMTLLGQAVGKEPFKKDIIKVIEMINALQNDISFMEDSSVRDYVITGWQRLVMLMEGEIVPMLKPIMP